MSDVALKNLDDLDVWLRCFAGAITGLLSSPQTSSYDPDQLTKQASKLADLALGKAQTRRPALSSDERRAQASAASAGAGPRASTPPARRAPGVADAWDVTGAGETQDEAPAFPFYASDFLSATGLMSNASVGAHVRMLAHAWATGPIPDRPAALARAMSHSVGDPPFDELWSELQPQWFLTRRGWINCRLELVRWERACFVEKQNVREKPPAPPAPEPRSRQASAAAVS
jgi:uncharacterized protein YdaU (DUF1376 family)